MNLKTKIVEALDGHTKLSRDCNLSGEYLAGFVLPIVQEFIVAERERCALIAESSALHHNGIKVGTGIAARIRALTNQ